MGASPVGSIAPVSEIGHPHRGAITLSVNGDTRQVGDISDLIWGAAEILSRLSHIRIHPGDIVFTGTPKGPRPVEKGDTLAGAIEGVGDLAIGIG